MNLPAFEDAKARIRGGSGRFVYCPNGCAAVIMPMKDYVFLKYVAVANV